MFIACVRVFECVCVLLHVHVHAIYWVSTYSFWSMAWVEVEVRVGKRALLECLRSGAGSYIMPMGILKRYYKDVCVWEKWSISVMNRNTKINPIKSNFCYIKRLKDISTARLTTPRSPSACAKTSRRHVSMAYRFTICNYCSSLYN